MGWKRRREGAEGRWSEKRKRKKRMNVKACEVKVKWRKGVKRERGEQLIYQ